MMISMLAEGEGELNSRSDETAGVMTCMSAAADRGSSSTFTTAPHCRA